MKNVLLKLKQVRGEIKSSNLKKSGRNSYSGFDYYTPEQIDFLVDNACRKFNSIVLCNLKADEFGLFQTLDFIDLDSYEKLSFEMRTKHGSIKATNETQQMGGTDTYSERYIKMKVFQIKDNKLDFDSYDNQPKNVAKKSVKLSDIIDTIKKAKSLNAVEEIEKKVSKMKLNDAQKKIISNAIKEKYETK